MDFCRSTTYEYMQLLSNFFADTAIQYRYRRCGGGIRA
jgi:hypothetical protein